jgi:Ran GTPase-activating protein (RanGAP) involved in mRNA processing and transport
MSVSMGTIDDGRASLSSTFLEFCAKVRNNDPSILPELGKPFMIHDLSERQHMELADALLENTRITYLKLKTEKYTKNSVEAIAKYVRTSKRLQRIRWNLKWDAECQQREKELCCFLSAIQKSTSLKELEMELPLIGGTSNLALENMLTHTQSLRSLRLVFPVGRLDDITMATARSGLEKNITLQELTLAFSWGGTTTDVSRILTSMREHPLLRRLCLRGNAVDVTGLETVLLSDTSKIAELDLHRLYGGPRRRGSPVMGLTGVLKALARRPTLTKLGIRHCPLGRDEARLLLATLCNNTSLQTLVLQDCDLGHAMRLAELAPALYHNTSIKVLDISGNRLDDMESAESLRDIIRRNTTMTTLDLSENRFGQTTGAIDCIAEGLGSNSTLLKINLRSCDLRDGGVSTLAPALGSRNTTLQKVTLGMNFMTSTGVGVLLETMEQRSHHIMDLDLENNRIGNEGASLVARTLGNNALVNLTRLSLFICDIGDDGFIALVSALEQNTSLLHLDLRYNDFTERAILALAESLPKIKMLQQLDFSWCTGLASAMPLLLAGLRKNTSLFRFRVANCAPSSVPPTPEETARCAGGWMQEMERLGYRNRFLHMIRAPKETLPPLGVWPHALARVTTLPDVIFEVLRSKPDLVSSEDMKATEDTGIP